MKWALLNYYYTFSDYVEPEKKQRERDIMKWRAEGRIL